jgi:hypothetical protein
LPGTVNVHARSVFIYCALKAGTARFSKSRKPAEHNHHMKLDKVQLQNHFFCLQCPTCKDCASEELDCFVIDNNGYVVLAEDRNFTGRFFGDLEGAVMDSLRTGNVVFRKVPMFDYQGLCTDDEGRGSSNANFILTVSFVFMLYNLTHPLPFFAAVKF